MACSNNCNPLPPCTYVYSPTSCTTSTNCVGDTSQVMYSGPALTCLDLESNTTLEVIIQTIDTKICEVSGIDWSTFDYGCLTDTYTIQTAAQFVQAISEVVCNLSTTGSGGLDDLQQEVDDLETLVDDINAPGPIDGCGDFVLLEGDTIQSAFIKVGTELCNIHSLISQGIGLPDWNNCFVTTTPTTLQGAFSILINQICSLSSDVDGLTGVTLPTFNNVGSCLASPGATDALYDTVVKIRTKLCTLPTFDIDALTWASCVTNPSPGSGANLTAVFNRLIDRTNSAYGLRVVTWSSDFDVVLTSPGDPCSGYSVSLNPSAGVTDELVALDASDTPGYLLDKLSAGTGIDLDSTSTPGTLIINSTSLDVLVKADSADAAGGYLIDKIEGEVDADNVLSLNESYDGAIDKVKITPSFNWANAWTALIAEAVGNPTIMAEICAQIVCACDCSSTTTSTTTTAPDDFIVFSIINNTDVDRNPSFHSEEAGPVTLFSTPSILVPTLTTFTSGAYFTVSSQPITGEISLTNNEIEPMDYAVTVVDGANVAVPGSSTFSGTLVSGATIVMTPFVYGSVIGKYVRVTLS